MQGSQAVNLNRVDALRQYHVQGTSKRQSKRLAAARPVDSELPGLHQLGFHLRGAAPNSKPLVQERDETLLGQTIEHDPGSVT